MSAPHARTVDPTLEELTEMLDAFSECGIAAVDLTGGEPLIRPDFFDLVDRIRERKIIIRTIFSNGLLVTDDFLQELTDRRMRPMIQMSFDGVGWHDWMRGVPGAEQTVLDAFRRCQRKGFPTSASMVVFRENIGTIRDTVKLLAGVGVSSLKISIALPAGEWKNETEHYLTREEVYNAYLDYIPKYFEDGTPLPLIMEGMFIFKPKSGRASSLFEKNCPEKEFGHVFSCGQMRKQLYVSPDGTVLPCMSMIGTEVEPLFPNMKKTPLKEILSKSYYEEVSGMTIREFMDANKECAECEFRERCGGGCRAAAPSSGTGGCYAKDPSACAYFKNGWYKRKEALFKELGINDDGNFLSEEGCD
jgi:radical SAM protein with 4Fe4S-binding SPASM domain